jgi:alkylation response protein AidB-like acyl-CoA dehydrogenase
MDFTLTPEQAALRRTVTDLALDRCSGNRLRDVIENHEAYDADLWRLVAIELGLVGVAVSEEHGGFGGSFVDAAVVLEAAGAALLPVPLLTATVAAVALDRCDSQVAAELVASVAVGERRTAMVCAADVTSSDDVLSGTVRHVIDGHRADTLVVATPDSLWVVEAAQAGVEIDAAPSVDLIRWQATVSFDSAPAVRVGDAVASGVAVDLLRVALAVESVGAARRCVDSTVAYLKTREQFGRPIGSFQALQHRAADLVVDLEAATSTAYYAAWVAADSPNELSVVAPMAKAVCADAAYRIAAETIQLHGGIGFTWEHDAHLYFKRAMATRLMLGDAHEQRRLVADRAGLLQPRAN